MANLKQTFATKIVDSARPSASTVMMLGAEYFFFYSRLCRVRRRAGHEPGLDSLFYRSVNSHLWSSAARIAFPIWTEIFLCTVMIQIIHRPAPETVISHEFRQTTKGKL
jgi:hypothetical protein